MMFPPRRVKIRSTPTSTESRVKSEIFPPASVMMPGGVSPPPRLVPSFKPPPGAKTVMSPPLRVFRAREERLMEPSRAAAPKSVSMAAVPAA